MQIKKIALSKLLKLEIPQLAKLVLEIVEKHEPETLLLDIGFNAFSKFEPEIESLIVGYGPHALNRRIAPLREKRIKLASSFSFQIRGMLHGYLNGSEEAMWLLKDASDLYLRDLRNNNEEIINERVDQFLNSLNQIPALTAAITTLEMMPQLDELRAAHVELMALLSQRNASISARPKGVLAGASKAIRNGMKKLFNRIELAHEDNEELDYKPLINELNEQLTRYGSLIKLRKSIRDRHPETHTKYGFDVPVGLMSHLSVADATTNGFDKDLVLSLDQKKTAAPASKLLQPSTVEKKAQ